MISGVQENQFSYITVSWIYRGQSQENSSLLQFNYLDSLTLGCIANSGEYNDSLAFAITKGSTPPTLYFFADPEYFAELYTLNAEEISSSSVVVDKAVDSPLGLKPLQNRQGDWSSVHPWTAATTRVYFFIGK